ncbi:MAG: DUF2764 family protein [Flavobacteriales bacterium]|nr:DUF2764 family protein [Flavobacteriales bacterium]
MARNYYCLVAGLPDIFLGDKKIGESSIALKETLKEELHIKDYKMIELLYLPFDHKNIIDLLYDVKSDLDYRGLYSITEIAQLGDKKSFELMENDIFPQYIIDTLYSYHSASEKLSKVEMEALLYTNYVAYTRTFSNKFLKEVLEQELNTKNLFSALLGRKYDFEFEKELVGINDFNEALARSRTRDFGLANEYVYVEPILQIFEEDNIQEREFKLDKLKWDYIEDATFFNFFSVEKVMSFVLRLFIAERWIKLSPEEGEKLFKKLLNELGNNYEFPEEYVINHGRRK